MLDGIGMVKKYHLSPPDRKTNRIAVSPGGIEQKSCRIRTQIWQAV
jgi:hypothetical protein